MTGVLIPTATETEWLEARRHGITASEIAVVMGLSPWSSPYALYHRKLGNLPEQDQSDAMALGQHMESYVAAKFAERHPEFTIEGDGQTLYAHPDRSWQMATPDRLVYETYLRLPEGEYEAAGPPVGVLECKIDGGSDEWGDDGTDQIPVHYRAQLLWQMDVMGVGTGYLACLLWQRRKIHVYELTMDAGAQADLKIMQDTAQCFLDDIRDGIEPEIDWRPATTTALKRLHPSVKDEDVPVRRMPIIQYRAACRAYDQAKQRKKLAENRLRALLGDGHRIVSVHTGEVIARRDVYGVKEHTRKATTVDRLVAVTPKGEPS